MERGSEMGEIIREAPHAVWFRVTMMLLSAKDEQFWEKLHDHLCLFAILSSKYNAFFLSIAEPLAGFWQPKWRRFLAHVGPGALVAIGFLDPSNLETDMQAGADFKFEILAMRHPRKLVLAGCVTSAVVMTILSASLGWVAPNLISRKWTHHITTLLFFVFGIMTLWDGYNEDGDDELAEVEEKLDADFKSEKAGSQNKSKENDDTKKQKRPFMTQFLSPVFLKAFSLTFFGEWGDMSQIATIGLAADENTLGVVLGGVLAQALCTTAAVIGGKALASRISEKMVKLLSGALILVFGIMTLLSGEEGEL